MNKLNHDHDHRTNYFKSIIRFKIVWRTEFYLALLSAFIIEWHVGEELHYYQWFF